jgi:hypothetical protein
MSSASSAVGPKSYFGPAEGRPRTDLRVPGATSSFSDAVFCAAGAFFAAGVFLTVGLLRRGSFALVALLEHLEGLQSAGARKAIHATHRKRIAMLPRALHPVS